MIPGRVSCFGCKLPENPDTVCAADFSGSDTLQVKDYSRYHGTMFNPEHKKQRHDAVCPEDQKKAFALGEQMLDTTWE